MNKGKFSFVTEKIKKQKTERSFKTFLVILSSTNFFFSAKPFMNNEGWNTLILLAVTFNCIEQS